MNIDALINSELRKRVDTGLLIVSIAFFGLGFILILSIPSIFGTLEQLGIAPPLADIWMFLWKRVPTLYFALLIWIGLNIIHEFCVLLNTYQKNPEEGKKEGK